MAIRVERAICQREYPDEDERIDQAARHRWRTDPPSATALATNGGVLIFSLA
jgi:hypothetical protein